MPEKPHYITPIEYGGGFKQEPMVVQAAGPRVKNGDWLALTLTTSDATGSVEIRGRILTDAGEIVPFQQIMTFSGTGTQTAVVARLGGGWLQGFSVHRVSGTLTDGEVVAAVHLGTSEGANAAYECCLASGEVTNIRSLGMGAFLALSTTTVASSAPVMTVATNAPAAGAEWSFTVTAAQTWEIQAIRCQLVTSATAGNRVAAFIWDDGTNVLYESERDITIPASTTARYNCGAMGAYWAPPATANYPVPIPVLTLPAGGRIRSLTDTIKAGDQWSLVYILYRLYS